MADMCKEDEHSKDNREVNVVDSWVDLMMKTLSPHVVNCLVTSGYDSIDVILGMDTVHSSHKNLNSFF